MKRLISPFIPALFVIIALGLFNTSGVFADENACVACHSKSDVTPLQVKDWQQSKRSSNDVTCDVCHGDGHEGYYDVDNVKLPNAEICAECHSERFEQYKKGKHTLAYAVINAMPATHYPAAPACQTCDMDGGNHEMRTTWGFLAVRLHLPEDEQWKNDRVSILKTLGVLDPDGNPTVRLDAVKAADVTRLDRGKPGERTGGYMQ